MAPNSPKKLPGLDQLNSEPTKKAYKEAIMQLGKSRLTGDMYNTLKKCLHEALRTGRGKLQQAQLIQRSIRLAENINSIRNKLDSKKYKDLVSSFKYTLDYTTLFDLQDPKNENYIRELSDLTTKVEKIQIALSTHSNTEKLRQLTQLPTLKNAEGMHDYLKENIAKLGIIKGMYLFSKSRNGKNYFASGIYDTGEDLKNDKYQTSGQFTVNKFSTNVSYEHNFKLSRKKNVENFLNALIKKMLKVNIGTAQKIAETAKKSGYEVSINTPTNQNAPQRPGSPSNRPSSGPRISRRTQLANRFRSRSYPNNPNLTGVATQNADGSYTMKRSSRTLGQVIPAKYNEVTINGTKYYRIGKEFFTARIANNKRLRAYAARAFQRGSRASDALASFVERNRKRFLNGHKLSLGKASVSATAANTPEALAQKTNIEKIKKHSLTLIKKALTANGLNFDEDMVKKMTITLKDSKAAIKGKASGVQVVQPVITFPGGYTLGLTAVSLYKEGKKTKDNPLGHVLKYPSEISDDVIARVKAHHETEQNKSFKNTAEAIKLVEKELGITLTVGVQQFARTGVHPLYTLSFKTNAGKEITVNTSIFAGSADKPQFIARSSKELAQDIKNALGYSPEHMSAEKNIMRPLINALKAKYSIKKIDWQVIKHPLIDRTKVKNPISIAITDIQFTNGDSILPKDGQFQEKLFSKTGKDRKPSEIIQTLYNKVGKFIEFSDKGTGDFLKEHIDSRRLAALPQAITGTLKKRYYIGKLILKNDSKKNPGFGNIPLPHSISADAFSVSYATNNVDIPGLIARIKMPTSRSLYFERKLKGISVDLYKKEKGKVVPRTIKEIQDELTKKVLASKEIKEYERPYEANKKMDVADTIREIAKINKTLAEGLKTVFNNQNIRFDRIMYSKNHGIELQLRLQMGNKTEKIDISGVFGKKWTQEQLGNHLKTLSAITDSVAAFINTAKEMKGSITLDHFDPLNDGVVFTMKKDGYTFRSYFNAAKTEDIPKKIDSERALMEKTLPTMINILNQVKAEGGKIENLQSSIKNGRYEMTGSMTFDDLELNFKVDFAKNGEFKFFVYNGVDQFVAVFVTNEKLKTQPIAKGLHIVDRSLSTAKTLKDVITGLKNLKKNSPFNVKGKTTIRNRSFISKSLTTTKKGPLEIKREQVKKKLDSFHKDVNFKRMLDNRKSLSTSDKALVSMYDTAYKLLDRASKIDATRRSWSNLAGNKERLIQIAQRYIDALTADYKAKITKPSVSASKGLKAFTSRGFKSVDVKTRAKSLNLKTSIADIPAGHEKLFAQTSRMNAQLNTFKKQVDAIRRKKAQDNLMKSIIDHYDSVASTLVAVESIAYFSSAGYIPFPKEKTAKLMKTAQETLKSLNFEIKTYTQPIRVVVDKKPLDMSPAKKYEKKALKQAHDSHKSKRLINPFAQPKEAPKVIGKLPKHIAETQKQLDAIYKSTVKRIKDKSSSNRSNWENEVLNRYDAAYNALQNSKDFSVVDNLIPHVPVIDMGMNSIAQDNLREIATLQKMPKNVKEVGSFLQKALGLDATTLSISGKEITFKAGGFNLTTFTFNNTAYNQKPYSFRITHDGKSFDLYLKDDGTLRDIYDNKAKKVSMKKFREGLNLNLSI